VSFERWVFSGVAVFDEIERHKWIDVWRLDNREFSVIDKIQLSGCDSIRVTFPSWKVIKIS
jgi:hypothetical protein